MTALLAADYPTFSLEMLAWMNSADLLEIYGEYSDNYKDIHGIRPRWVEVEASRKEWADRFVALGNDAKEQAARDAADHEAFKAKVASLGLTEWCERNGINNEWDLNEYNHRQHYEEEAA